MEPEILEEIALLDAVIGSYIDAGELEVVDGLLSIKRRLIRLANPPLLKLNISTEQWDEALTMYKAEHADGPGFQSHAVLGRQEPTAVYIFEGITREEIVSLDHREIEALIELVQGNQDFFGDPPAGRDVFRVCREFLEAAIERAGSNI